MSGHKIYQMMWFVEALQYFISSAWKSTKLSFKFLSLQIWKLGQLFAEIASMNPSYIEEESNMTRKSLTVIRCIISGEDEDEDPQQLKLKCVKQDYDMIT